MPRRLPLAPGLIGLSLLSLGACTRTADIDRIEPTSIVATVEDDLGSPEAPLDFSGSPITRTISVQTLDKNGDPYPFNGDLTLRVRPGKLDQSQWVTLTEGVWQGEVTFHAAFGPTRIWVGDEGDKDAESGRTPSYATGVTEAVNYAFPTIRQMNEIDDHETNHLSGEFAELQVSDRQVVVTEIGTNGFWVTDIADEAGSWNSLYVYSFSKPTGIWEGARLTILTGNTQEYLATTQISFPVYEAEPDVTLDVPDPIELPATATCDNNLMEGMESSLVMVSDASIPADFTEGSEDWEDYLAYGQWPIELASGGCRLYGDSSTSPDFHPTDHAGEEIGEVTGMLREIWGKWIITARSEGDLGGGGFEEDRQPDPDAGIRHARPRHRPGTEPATPHHPQLRAPSAPGHDHGHGH